MLTFPTSSSSSDWSKKSVVWQFRPSWLNCSCVKGLLPYCVWHEEFCVSLRLFSCPSSRHTTVSNLELISAPNCWPWNGSVRRLLWNWICRLCHCKCLHSITATPETRRTTLFNDDLFPCYLKSSMLRSWWWGMTSESTSEWGGRLMSEQDVKSHTNLQYEWSRQISIVLLQMHAP